MTFKQPPLDGSLTLPEIYDWHLDHSPNHPLFVFRSVNEGLHNIVWSQGVQTVHLAANFFLDQIGANDGRTVIAILAITDAFSYFIATMGLMRAGYQPFPLSNRNSPAGIAHLIKEMKVTHILITDDQPTQQLLAASIAVLASRGIELQCIPLPRFGDELIKPSQRFKHCPFSVRAKPDDIALILHSSGSTTFPKPIISTHRMLIERGRAFKFGDTDFCGHVMSTHSVPMYRKFRQFILPRYVVTSLYRRNGIDGNNLDGLAISGFGPDSPIATPSPEQVLLEARATESSMMICVPSYLEMFAGAPLSKHVGDFLVSARVPINLVYGSTETGPIAKMLPLKPHPEGWEYFELSPDLHTILVPEGEDRVFRLVLAPSDAHAFPFTNSRVDGRDVYDTNDLLERHPSNPHLYRLYGRSDDQLMHSTGEKTSPVPIESILTQHPKVWHAVMFGRGRFHAGVIIEPTPECAVNPLEHSKVAQFMEEIEYILVKANTFAPAHSKIFKEMVLIADPKRPLEYTPKGTPKRSSILQVYAKEIEDAYIAFEETSSIDVSLPESWTPAYSLELARAVINKVLPDSRDIKDDADIFQLGCDSLHATHIHNTLVQYLRRFEVDVADIPRHFVYMNPTIERLARFLSHTASPHVADQLSPDNGLAGKIKQMTDLVSKYTSDLPAITGRSGAHEASEEVVLLTGSTGGLGTFVLETLLMNPDIKAVYALNRKGVDPSETLQFRQAQSFERNGIDVRLLGSPQLTLVEADVTQPDLGISPSLYEELRTRVTCIIHNAWKVDFNLSLLSMEPLVAGTRHLVDLALASPHASTPKFVFVSSVGVFSSNSLPFLPQKVLVTRTHNADATKLGPIPEEPVLDPSVSVGTGYSESKWVTETMLHTLSQRTALRPTVVRLGQLCGGRNGRWRASEWFPAIVCGGRMVGSLPILQGDATWLPTHVAAAALVEMRTGSETFLNLQHPRPVPLSSIMAFVSSLIGVPLVPFEAWIANLEAKEGVRKGIVAGNGQNSPALQLLEFFKASLRDNQDSSLALQTPDMAIERALLASPTLSAQRSLTTGDMESWVTYWRSLGY
ncbi:putative NRPS-like protein biosynthetic cluster [Pleurotus pulmonarius]|nr:putative NRPS-like protein biosynthetic cluster [Pleurotus pulmonarius]KAF4588785.1 putative NRPS-like protein biosynthetic cluster [Pleurotus pulmonarius]